MNIARKSTAELHNLLETAQDEWLIDEIWDELERRDRDEELRDWTEQDARAAQEERFELWRREQ